MKPLLDENRSRRIVPTLQEAYPGSTQVILEGLERAGDRAIWDFAKSGGFTIVTKDDDFLGLLSLLGYPPKIVFLALGNTTNEQIVDALVRSRREIEDVLANDDIGLV